MSENTEKPIVGWEIRLKGRDQDLKDAIEHFCSGNAFNVDQDQPGYVLLRSPEFLATLGYDEVKALATEYLVRINGALKMHFSDFQSLELEGICGVQPDGSFSVHAEIQMKGTGRLRVTGHQANVPGADAPNKITKSDAFNVAELSSQDNAIREILGYLARPCGWFELYKILEVITTSCVDEYRSQNSNTPTAGVGLALLGVSELDGQLIASQSDRIRRTANYYHRHSQIFNQSRTPPSDPIPFDEAEHFIQDLAQRFFRHRR